MDIDQQNATIIAALNDRFRHTFWGGQVMTTCGVNELSDDKRAALFNSVRDFDNFVQDNDPHGEHDFGKVMIDDQSFFWKIDYYAPDMEHGSENPADPTQTVRVLTIMLASDY